MDGRFGGKRVRTKAITKTIENVAVYVGRTRPIASLAHAMRILYAAGRTKDECLAHLRAVGIDAFYEGASQEDGDEIKQAFQEIEGLPEDKAVWHKKGGKKRERD